MFNNIINSVNKAKENVNIKVNEVGSTIDDAHERLSTIGHNTLVKIDQTKADINHQTNETNQYIKNKQHQVITDANNFKDGSIEIASNALTQPEKSISELNIKNHYLEGTKYGMKGSDGTWSSNYYRHSMNNHPLLSLFFSDELNPFDSKRRKMVFFCTYSVAFFMSSVWMFYLDGGEEEADEHTSENEILYAFITTLIMTPISIILNYAGACTYCYKYNTCTGLAHTFGLFFLIVCTFMASSFFIGGIAIVASQKEDKIEFLKTFLFTLGLLIYLYHFPYFSY
jgi:hypothetical protein